MPANYITNFTAIIATLKFSNDAALCYTNYYSDESAKLMAYSISIGAALNLSVFTTYDFTIYSSVYATFYESFMSALFPADFSPK